MRHCLLISVLLGFSLIQCSSENATTKYPHVASFCTGRAEAECNDTIVETCAAASKDDCIAKRVSVCEDTIATPAEQADLTYDSRQGEACVNEVSRAYADAKVTSAEERSISEACSLVFSGPGKEGSTCTADIDCRQSDGLRCVVHVGSTLPADPSPGSGGAGSGGGAATAGAAGAETDGAETGGAAGAGTGGAETGGAAVVTSEGTCQTPKAVQGGGSCSAADAQCIDGYHCGVSLHCDQDEDAGAPCTMADPCGAGLKCSDAGICAVKLANGETCVTAEDCTKGICLEGAKICASVITLSASEPFCAQLR